MERNMTENQSMAPENRVIKLVRQITQNSSLSLYAGIWSKAGFTITLNYYLTRYKTPPLCFSSTPLSLQVSQFQLPQTWAEEAAAWELTTLIPPFLISQQYKNHFDLWAKAGFHITPIPAPKVENPKFKPNFFLLGTAKSGSTMLHTLFDKIPDIAMSKPKEPFFFEAEYELGLEHYRKRYFSHWNGEPITGDARHRNLYLPFIAKRIAALNPNAKLVICLRNPIERAYSHWWHWYARDVEDLDFEQAVQEDLARIEAGWSGGTAHEMDVYKATLDATGKGIYRSYIDSGYYYQQIERYLIHFPQKQIKIILLDDLQQSSHTVIKELEAFLGIDYYTPVNFNSQAINPALPENTRKRTPITAAFRAFLQNHYQTHNAQLAHFINRDLSHWQ